MHKLQQLLPVELLVIGWAASANACHDWLIFGKQQLLLGRSTVTVGAISGLSILRNQLSSPLNVLVKGGTSPNQYRMQSDNCSQIDAARGR